MEVQADINGLISLSWIIGFLLAMLVVVYYLFSRNRILKLEAEKQLIAFGASFEAEEKQREKLAADLHDEVLPLLTSLQQKAEEHEVELKNKSLGPEKFDIDIKLIEQCVQGIQAISFNLVPNILIRFGLASALEQFVLQLNTRTEAVQFEDRSNFSEEIPLSKIEQAHVYRMCLEILNNLRKHAKYNALFVEVSNTQDELIISLRHDGKGVTNEEIETFTRLSTGLGLKSLRSRAILLNAGIIYEKGKNFSTVSLTVPLKA